MSDLKMDEVLQLSKIGAYIKEKSEDEQVKKTVKIILICVGALTIIAAAAYVVYRILNRYDDEYDLYDDLDYYYDEDDEEAKADADEACEEDFAE